MADQPSTSGRPAGRPSEIAALNDWLRNHIASPGHNRVVMTVGIADLIGDVSLFRGFRKRAELLRLVRDYDSFGEAINPHGERDLGRFEFEGTACYWKIDYYNLDMDAGAENPADPFTTTRVLTIMRVDER